MEFSPDRVVVRQLALAPRHDQLFDSAPVTWRASEQVDDMAPDKVRIRFRKAGDLRFLSHHDLLRAFERVLRRAELPFASSGGFHPTPRLVFALALPLGIAGLREVVEIELTERVEPEVVGERLRRGCPPGLTILEVQRVDPRQTARPVRAIYQLPLPPDRIVPTRERCQELLAATSLPVARTRPTPKTFDLRPTVIHLSVPADTLILELAIDPQGSARADELLPLLGLGDLQQAGAFPERTDLLIADELESPLATTGQPASDGERSPASTQGHQPVPASAVPDIPDERDP